MANTDTDDIIHFKYLGDKKWQFRVNDPPQWQNYTQGTSPDIELTETDIEKGGSGYYIQADIHNDTNVTHTFWAAFKNSLSQSVCDSSMVLQPQRHATLFMQGVKMDPNGKTIEWWITTDNGDPRLKITYKTL